MVGDHPDKDQTQETRLGLVALDHENPQRNPYPQRSAVPPCHGCISFATWPSTREYDNWGCWPSLTR